MRIEMDWGFMVENWCWDGTLGDLVPAHRIDFAVEPAR